MLVWPCATLRARNPDWIPAGGAITGGGTRSGLIQTAMLTGGPFWRLTADIVMRTRDAQAAAVAIRGALVGGAPIDMRICERLRAGALFGRSVPHSDGTSFSDGSLYAGSPVAASCPGGAVLRATTLTIAIDAALRGAEPFSADHPNMGRRRYEVSSILSQSGGSATITINMPLREALAAGEVLDFNDPSCLMTLPTADAFPLPLPRGGLLRTTIQLQEWFGESVAPEPPQVSDLLVEDTGAGQATISFRLPYSSKFEGGSYEIWRGAAGAAFSACAKINGPTAGARGAAVSINHTGLSGTYRWYVPAKSAAGEFIDPPAYYQVAIT